MTDYAAPLADMRFVIEDLIGLAPIAALPGLADASDDTVALVLSEAGKLAAQTLAPLNQSGDREGARLENGVVRTAEGFAEAYRAFVDGG